MWAPREESHPRQTQQTHPQPSLVGRERNDLWMGRTLPPPSLVGRERNDLWMKALLDGDHPPPSGGAGRGSVIGLYCQSFSCPS